MGPEADPTTGIESGQTAGRHRRLPTWLARVVGATAVGWSGFQLLTAYVGTLPALEQRAIHLGAALVLVFALFPAAGRARGRVDAWLVGVDVACVAVGVGACAYIAFNHYDIVSRSGSYTTAELALAGAALVVLLEATRRTLGWGLPATALLALLYAYFGRTMPELVAHQGFSIERIVGFLLLTTEGVFGLILGVSADFIFLFILLAMVVQRLGGGQFFVDLSLAVFGWARGGAAKIAVVASGLFGMISGSTVANAGTSGTITIPMMKRSGFQPTFAAAVESVASCGGQIMPPIMGTGAFLMAELLDISYAHVALAAAVPAILYYAALFLMVDLEAARQGLRGLPREALPRLASVVRGQGYLTIPLIVLVVLLGALDYTPRLAAFWSVVAAAPLVIVSARGRWLPRLVAMLRDGAVAATEVAVVCGCVGIVVGIVMMTGLGLKLSQVLIAVSGGDLLLLLVLTMLASLILGTALPTTPTYLILAVLVAPALIEMGVKPLPAHLFIFYYGVLADITPPTALCAYVAASIAGAPFLRTTCLAVVLSFAGYLLPFIFVLHPELILIGSPGAIAWRTLTAVGSIIGLGLAIRGHASRSVRLPWRIAAAAAALGLPSGWLAVEIAALLLLIVVIRRHRTCPPGLDVAGAPDVVKV